MILSPPIERAPTLLSAPIELAGNWGRMVPRSGQSVVERMRSACLDGVRVVSDRQPTRIRIDRHTSGPPAVWLHPDGSSMAWIIVDTGERAWMQLAYQFGHELGHVTANSWQPHAKPATAQPMARGGAGGSLHAQGLGAGWPRAGRRNPPFPGDYQFGDGIAKYRQNITRRYNKLAAAQGLAVDPATWFAKHRKEIEVPALNPFAQAASLKVLAEYEQTPDCVEALGALNRWPGRTGVPIEEYFRQWEVSCAELQANLHLPKRLREIWRIGQ